MTATMDPDISPLSCPPRFGTRRNHDRATLGPHVAKVAELLGKPFMPWQRHVVDIAMEVDEDGSLHYSQVVLTVPRQSGKTTLLLPVLVHRSIAEFPGGNLDVGPRRQSVAYTAQSRNDARKKWIKEFTPLLESSPFRHQFTKRLSNGTEGWDWANGSTFDLMATMEKSGHGDTLDLGIIDEAFAQVDDRLMQAIKPATATRRSPQTWITSTAGESAVKSPFLFDLVSRGRLECAAGESSFAFFEWSMAEDDDTTDAELVAAAHPAIGHTITAKTIRSEMASMSHDGFRRAYCNIWGSTETRGHLPMDAWDRCAELRSRPDGELCFAVDVAPDRSRASIVAAGTWVDDHFRNGDGYTSKLVRPVVEIVDQRPGLDWVLDRCAELNDRHRPKGWIVDALSQAGSLAHDLELRGLNVHRAPSREVIHAAGRMFDAVTDRRLAHRDQPEMRVAVAGAVKRDVGDAWLFARKAASVDVSAVIAGSLALHLLEVADIAEPPAPKPVFAF